MIYFVQAGKSGPIKIGCTDHLRSRLRNLQSGHYRKLILLGTMPGNVDIEHKLHESFIMHHLRGEWFEPALEILDFIRNYCNHGETNMVHLVEDGQCRIIFAQPMNATSDLIGVFGSHRVRLLGDEELSCVIGVEGKPAVIEDLLITMGIDDQAVDGFRKALKTE